MKAILTEEFRCAPDGVNVETLPVGAEVEGALAQSAITQGKAKPPRGAKKEAPANKADQPPQNKAENSPAE